MLQFGDFCYFLTSYWQIPRVMPMKSLGCNGAHRLRLTTEFLTFFSTTDHQSSRKQSSTSGSVHNATSTFVYMASIVQNIVNVAVVAASDRRVVAVGGGGRDAVIEQWLVRRSWTLTSRRRMVIRGGSVAAEVLVETVTALSDWRRQQVDLQPVARRTGDEDGDACPSDEALPWQHCCRSWSSDRPVEPTTPRCLTGRRWPLQPWMTSIADDRRWIQRQRSVRQRTALSRRRRSASERRQLDRRNLPHDEPKRHLHATPVRHHYVPLRSSTSTAANDH